MMMENIDIQNLIRFEPGQFDRSVLEALLQQMPSGVVVAEAPSGRLVFANPQMDGILRRPALNGVEDWVGFGPLGRRYTRDDWPIVRSVRGGETVENEEIEVLRGDGTRGVLLCSSVPVRDGSGRTIAAVQTCLDVTDQRKRVRSKRFLSEAGTLLSASLDYVATLRNLARLAVPTLADWCTIDLLEKGELDRVAIEHVDATMAKAASQVARRHPPTLETELAVARVVESGRSELYTTVGPDVLDRFTRHPRIRGGLDNLAITSAMVVPIVARGEPLGAIVFATSDSGRRYTLDDLEIAEELATRAALSIENSRLFNESRAATEAKSDFLAVMSHELRTPLTAIIGYSELLQLGVPDPVTERQKEQAERIELSARHLLQLIEEILTLVTLESGERRVHRDEMNVNALLQKASATIEPLARAKNLDLVVELAADDPILRSDADKLLQVLLNLLSNAVKFTERGEIRLTAELGPTVLEIEVRDTGIGLDEEHRRRIFDPFWQVERPINRRAGGTGLGLTISRRLIDLLGGEIEVESEQGKGSTFRVRVPV
jgi:signal transduction histidine kinase